jgi:hypothetical protein
MMAAVGSAGDRARNSVTCGHALRFQFQLVNPGERRIDVPELRAFQVSFVGFVRKLDGSLR